MFYVYASLMVMLNGVWLLVSLAGIPGNWLMIGSAVLLAMVYDDRNVFHYGTFVAVLVLAVIGEAIELAAGAYGARKFGGSIYSSIGALGGGLVGAIVGTGFMPVIGTIGGAVAGAFSGAMLAEMMSGKDKQSSIQAGKGAAIGHITGNLTKFALGCVIWLTIAIAVFNP